MKQIQFIGLGLIGGSYALDISRRYPEVKRIGYDTSKLHRDRARELGVVDVIDDAIQEDTDLIIVAIPVDETVRVLPQILDQIADHTLVIDVGSTKLDICQSVKDHPKRRNFMATHPIAGTEFTGPDAAIYNLFEGKTNIICEIEETAFKLQEAALNLFTQLGMRIRYMKPKAHDKHIAYVSHLSHISSFMLGKTVIEKEQNERDIFDMAGSGFESTVRLAKSSPAMWTPIFKQNRNNVIETLEEYIENLSAFKTQLEKEDYDAIFNQMEQTNRIKQILKGIAL